MRVRSPDSVRFTQGRSMRRERMENAERGICADLIRQASTPFAFTRFLEQIFGSDIDRAVAEEIYRRVLRRNFSFLPDAVAVTRSELGGTATGAYQPGNSTVLIAGDLSFIEQQDVYAKAAGYWFGYELTAMWVDSGTIEYFGAALKTDAPPPRKTATPDDSNIIIS